MSVKQALLIGVPRNKRDPTLNLPVVYNDISLLHDSLESCGYSVTSCGIDDPSEVSSNLIVDAIQDACVEAPEDSTLILYFSGHGIHYGGKDLLVPWDGHFKDPSRIEKSLVSTDIASGFVDRSRARLVVFFIDACREGIQWEFKSFSLRGWGLADIQQANQRRLILVYSCRPGELSQYVGGQDGFSLFSKALATVLAPTHPAETVGEVIRATQEELDKLIRKYGKAEQHIRTAAEQDIGSELLSFKISDRHGIEVNEDTANAKWQEAVTETRLWRLNNTPESPSVSSLIESSSRIVAACEREWSKAVSALPSDPWRDYTYPLRVITCLEMLVSSCTHFNLSYAEAGVLVTAPFIREAIYSCSDLSRSEAHPLDLSTQGNSLSLSSRRRLEMTHAAYPQLIRKATRTHDGTASNAIAFWLMHRSIMRDPDTWQAYPDGHISTELFKVLSSLQDRASGFDITQRQLIEFAQCINCDPARIERADRTDVLRERLILGEGKYEQEIREQLLGYLLCIAGWMALDIRAMSDLLPDHLGIADPINPLNLLQALKSANWRAIGTSRSVYVECQHPAIDYSIRELVTRANEVLIAIHRRVTEKGKYLEVLSGLPSRLGTELIVPKRSRGKAAYETPHLNFQLAHDEVRELLMGEQLYDKPELAIRELYQNALDACRYRRARLQYLERTGHLDHSKEWQGRIEFEQGKDKQKGRYIECRDNGIGMSRHEIESCFAKAGKRFCDLPEFIEEQSEWLRCNPPIRMYPNSQFGVGVFSYFMLADELEIETCRMDRKGRPLERLLITIPGSGSLFRIQELGPGKDAGTRVRLYLRDSKETEEVSCVSVLSSLLWVAEFWTKAKHGRQHATWLPGALRHPYGEAYISVKDTYLPIWWTTRHGGILADGIHLAIDPYQDKINEDLKTLLSIGLVINLTGEYKPSLTVDRRKARSWDESWILNSACLSVRSLYDWEALNYTWLWSLLSVFPDCEELLNRELSSRRRIIPMTYSQSGIQEKLSFSSRGRDTEFSYGHESPGLNIHLDDPKSISFGDIGLTKVQVSDVGVSRRDAQLWHLVWEAWNWELEENKRTTLPTRYKDRFALESTYLEPHPSGDRENHRQLELTVRLSKWNKELNNEGVVRLETWQHVGLVLPNWLTVALHEFKSNGLAEHYLINFIPKSGPAWARIRNIVMSVILRLKLRPGDQIIKLLIAIVLLGLIYLLTMGSIALTKYVLGGG